MPKRVMYHLNGSLVGFYVFSRFSVDTVDSNGDDLALVRLPSLAVTINEDPEENVQPVCVPWKGNELVIGFKLKCVCVYLYNGRPRNPKIVAVVDRWSPLRGSR